MGSRLVLARSLLSAIRLRRRFWRLAQKGLLLDISTGDIIEG